MSTTMEQAKLMLVESRWIWYKLLTRSVEAQYSSSSLFAKVGTVTRMRVFF
jgi:hypothetical protein